MIGKLCIEEVRVGLEHLCSCSRKQCRIFHGSFSVNNYPLVYIHCIIKIMCQALVLGWLDCLFTMCRKKNRNFGCSAWIYIFYWKVKWVWNFAHYFCTISSNLVHNFRSYRSLLNFQITTDCPVFDRFCFSRVVCLFWWIYG